MKECTQISHGQVRPTWSFRAAVHNSVLAPLKRAALRIPLVSTRSGAQITGRDRNEELKTLDVEQPRAVSADKHAFRDLPQNFDWSKAIRPDELGNLWPVELDLF
jgi:hypothetical protein